MTTIIGDTLVYFVADEPEAFNSITMMYDTLLGGVPNRGGYSYLVWKVLDTNYGYSEDYSYGAREFNQENAFIDIANSLIAGNDDAAGTFAGWLDGATTLPEQVAALYNELIVPSERSTTGLDWLIRPEALAYYEQAALERGVMTENGAAVAALGSIMNIAIHSNEGIGDALHDLREAILDGSHQIPDTSDSLVSMEDADGTKYDDDDTAFVVGGVALGQNDALGVDMIA